MARHRVATVVALVLVLVVRGVAARARDLQLLRSVGANAGGQLSGPVLVDFYVFLGEDAGAKSVAPRASMNIGGTDKTDGYYVKCKDECETWTEKAEGRSYTWPQMRICKCVAELMVEDLSHDFGELVPTGHGPVFAMGDYKEVDAGQDKFDIKKGHKMLHTLMSAASDKPFYRRPGRLTVWIASDIEGHSENTELAGTTYLDQPLYVGSPGAGVLLQADVSREERRLSHEVGHVVGFHHVAGEQGLKYVYSHAECPAETRVKWKLMSQPNCDVNIMGSWYDGPYCCPWVSFLSRLGALRTGSVAKCLPQDPKSPKAPYCCGKSCSHECPKEMPAMTFATSEHKDDLAKILSCWLHLRTVKRKSVLLARNQSASSTREMPAHGLVQCVDYSGRQGPCSEV